MSKEKKNAPKKQKDQNKKKSEKEKEKENNDLDKELRQTFPASDPPSHSRPGHERTEDDDS